MKTINEEWKEVERLLLQDAPPIQKQEMKRAFFAGFDTAINSMLMASTLPEEEAIKRLERYRQEVKGFVEALKLGAA